MIFLCDYDPEFDSVRTPCTDGKHEFLAKKEVMQFNMEEKHGELSVTESGDMVY